MYPSDIRCFTAWISMRSPGGASNEYRHDAHCHLCMYSHKVCIKSGDELIDETGN